MAKYKGPIESGQIVMKRIMSGTAKGSTDESQKYIVKSIGPKQCRLNRIRDDGTETNRGHNIYIWPKEEAEKLNAQYQWSGYAYDWSQCLVPLSQAGWDPDCNF